MTEEWLAIYRETIGPVYGFVSRRVGGDRGLAEDLTQETYLRAIERWSNGPVPRDPLRWLRKVAGNLVVDHWRKRRPAPVDPARLASILDPDTVSENGAAEVLAAALPRLGRRARALIEAFHLDGKSVRTIARELCLSERAVEGRLRRARSVLKRRCRAAHAAQGGRT